MSMYSGVRPRSGSEIEARARFTDPVTSHEAAESVDTKSVNHKICAALTAHPDGGTTEEITEWTGLRLVTVSPMMKPMEKIGLVFRAGVRKNKSGRRAIIWRVR